MINKMLIKIGYLRIYKIIKNKMGVCFDKKDSY